MTLLGSLLADPLGDYSCNMWRVDINNDGKMDTVIIPYGRCDYSNDPELQISAVDHFNLRSGKLAANQSFYRNVAPANYVFTVNASDIDALYEEGQKVIVPFTARSDVPTEATVKDFYVEANPADQSIRKMVRVNTVAGMDVFEVDAVRPASLLQRAWNGLTRW